VGVLLESGRLLGEEIERRGRSFPALSVLAALLLPSRPLEDEIRRTVDADGSVLDGASPELRRIRDALRRAHTRIVRKLEEVVRGLPERFAVADASVTIRNGRYVIAVRREGRGEVGGVVVDESASGATLFVEPPAGIQMMNELGQVPRQMRVHQDHPLGPWPRKPRHAART
jgi:DNA mismatch repair protein MutS2